MSLDDSGRRLGFIHQRACEPTIEDLTLNFLIRVLSHNCGEGGPGEWVWKGRRKGRALDHQSAMSGQPIRTRADGVSEIREYKVEGVHFDDFTNNVLVDYKGQMGGLIKNGEFRDFGDFGYRSEVERQLKAAGGVPVEWRVGESQVEAFKKLFRKHGIRGVRIKP